MHAFFIHHHEQARNVCKSFRRYRFSWLKKYMWVSRGIELYPQNGGQAAVVDAWAVHGIWWIGGHVENHITAHILKPVYSLTLHALCFCGLEILTCCSCHQIYSIRDVWRSNQWFSNQYSNLDGFVTCYGARQKIFKKSPQINGQWQTIFLILIVQFSRSSKPPVSIWLYLHSPWGWYQTFCSGHCATWTKT